MAFADPPDPPCWRQDFMDRRCHTRPTPARRWRPAPRTARSGRPCCAAGAANAPTAAAGPLLTGYLSVTPTCKVCREELHHQRADDGPAYLTILIVGHLMAPLLGLVFVTWRPEPLTLFTIFAVGCVGLSLYLLPRLKGAMIGLQWARHMHGFGASA
jgi:uncharacterized protein (DUF983 family)